MLGILSRINWFPYFILIFTVGSLTSVSTPFSGKVVVLMAPMQDSTYEYNKNIVKHFFNEVVGQGNIDVVRALLAPNCKYYDAGSIKTTNIPEFIDYLEKARQPFDSIDVKIDNIIAEGNRIAVRYLYHSVLNGEPIIVPAMAEFLIEDGKIVEMWRYIPARSQRK